MFVAAVQIALPLGAALFVADIALGLLGRAAPRINVLVLGLGAKALIALLVAGLLPPCRWLGPAHRLSPAATGLRLDFEAFFLAVIARLAPV